MYAVKVTRKNYVTGKTTEWIAKARYKTLTGAAKAALKHEGICRPNGGQKTSETWAEVVNA